MEKCLLACLKMVNISTEIIVSSYSLSVNNLLIKLGLNKFQFKMNMNFNGGDDANGQFKANSF